MVDDRARQSGVHFLAAFVAGAATYRYVLNAGVARSLVLGVALGVGAAVGWYYVGGAESDA